MSDIYQDTQDPDVSLGQIYQGQIARQPLNFSALMDIVIPDVHPGIVFHNVKWQARDNTSLPQAGDTILAVFDNNNEPWVIAWWASPRNSIVSAGPFINGPPASPVNGDIWIAYSPITGRAWQFIFDANWTTDPYQWKFIGGGEGYQQISTQEDRPANSGIGDLATMGPSVPVDRPGLYHVRWGCLVNTHNAQQGGYAGAVITNSSGTRLSVYEADSAASNGGWVSAMTEEQITIDPAVTVKVQYFNSANQAVSFTNRWLSGVPLRVK